MIATAILMTAILTALACVIPGVFLVLRRMAMMSDAISHSVLPGIVIAYIIIQDRHSPLLILAAALSGLVMVILTEVINKSGLVKEDSSIGLIFPALFSFGVLLINQNLANVHFHESTVLLGDIALASLNRMIIFGTDIGPTAFYLMLGLLVINLVLLVLFYKELKLTTFDPNLAKSFGFPPSIVHYGFMTIVSITAVGAFETAGTILVIALMIAPASTAYLLTDRLKKMILFASVFAVLSATIGFYISIWTNTPPAGSISVMTGVFFLLAFLFSPKNGVIFISQRRKEQSKEFSKTILLLHLANHEGTELEQLENKKDELDQHVHWKKSVIDKTVAGLMDSNLIYDSNGILKLTEKGKQAIKQEFIKSK